jgi:Fe2+ or Zn2+ uptake regulation protein
MDQLDRTLSDTLRARGQRVTSQRLVIHRVLHELGTHATAEDVFGEVAGRLPGVSLPTVYATLDLLEELGAVRRVSLPGGAAVYDPRLAPHHHLVCRNCGRAEDVDVPIELEPVLAAAAAKGFTPRHAEVVVAGLCAACAN